MDYIPYTILDTDSKTLTAVDERGNKKRISNLMYSLYLLWIEYIQKPLPINQESLTIFPNQGGLV